MDIYYCAECNLNYKTRGGLLKHYRIHHRKTNSSSIDVKCSYCDKTFKHRQSKWRHEKDCKNKDTLETKVKKLSNEINKIKLNPQVINKNVSYYSNCIFSNPNKTNDNTVLNSIIPIDENNQIDSDINVNEIESCSETNTSDEDSVKKHAIISVKKLNQMFSDSELSSDTESEDEEPNAIEINVKGKYYLLEGVNVYVKNQSGTKGELYGIYTNGKIKKTTKTKEIVL